MKRIFPLFITFAVVATSYSMTISEGDYYQYVENFTGTVIMTGGTIVENLYVKLGSFGEVYGGYIGNFLVVDQTSEVWMYGGHVVSGISSPYKGKFNWYGGTIDGEIRSGWSSDPDAASSHKIYGYDFKIDGESITEYLLTNTQDFVGEFDRRYAKGRLTGFTQDGTPIDNDYIIYGDSTIELIVIPEPCTLLLLGLGGLLIRRR